jgi:uncharacterized membrane protein
METPSVFQKYAKGFIAALGVALLYGNQVFDVLGTADLSTADGVVAAVVGLLTVAGVVGATNKT